MAASSGGSGFRVIASIRGWGGTKVLPNAYAEAAFAKFFELGTRVLGRLKKEAPVSKYGPNVDGGQGQHLRDAIEQENAIQGGKATIKFNAPGYANIVIHGHGEIIPMGASALRFHGASGAIFSAFASPVAPNDFAKRGLDASKQDIQDTSRAMVWAAVGKFKERLVKG